LTRNPTRGPAGQLSDAEVFAHMQRLLQRIENMPDNTVSKSLARRRMLGLPAAEYIRVSSEPQAKNYGMASQRGDIRLACEEFGFDPPIYTYEDHISASGKLVRTDFERMLADARAGKFKILFVGRVDRFGRNEAAGWLYMYELVLTGVHVYFCDGDLAAGLDQEWREDFSDQLRAAAGVLRTIRKNINKSVRERRRDGVFIGHIAYGWRKGPDKNPEFNPEEIGAVDRIVELCLQDQLICRQIADKLNDEGYVFRGGRRFTKSNVNDILRNPILIGAWRINKDTEREVILLDRSPARLRPGQWARINEILDSRAKSLRRPLQRRRKAEFIFDRILRCGEIDPATGRECGLVFGGSFGAPKHRPGVVFRYFHPRGKGCCAGHFHKTWSLSEPLLLELLRPGFAGAKLPEMATQRIAQYLAEESLATGPDPVILRANYDLDLARINLALRRGAYGKDPAVAEKLWEKERDEIQAQIDALPAPPVLPADDEVAQVRDLPEIWAKANRAERREILATLIAAIYVTKSGGAIRGAVGQELVHGVQGISRIEPRPEYQLLLAYALKDVAMSGSGCSLRHAIAQLAPEFCGWLSELNPAA
jgi:DNA invertase Pin-like site-specific DNA recombinase